MESFGTSEDVSSVERQSFEKRMRKKVQMSCAWAVEPELTKESKVNPSLAESLDPNRLIKKNQQMIAGQGAYMIILCNFFIYDTATWVLDTRRLYIQFVARTSG